MSPDLRNRQFFGDLFPRDFGPELLDLPLKGGPVRIDLFDDPAHEPDVELRRLQVVKVRTALPVIPIAPVAGFPGHVTPLMAPRPCGTRPSARARISWFTRSG
jgi:hypothetical protein